MLILSRPAIYTLELTPTCDQRCVGCSNPYNHHNSRPYTSIETWEGWVSDFGPDAVRIRLTGGEPTLFPAFFRLLSLTLSFDALVTIFTNGRWHKPDIFLDKLSRYPNPPGLLISLHGSQPSSHEAFTNSPGSYMEVIGNIQKAIQRGILVAISTVITRYNLNELEAVCQLGLDLGVEHIAFNRYVGATDPEIEPNLNETRQAFATIEGMVLRGLPVQHSICLPQCFLPNSSKSCLAGSVQVTIDPWGNIRPCIYSTTIIGSLQQTTLKDIWHGNKMDSWRNSPAKGCDDCAAAAMCHGGCRAACEWHKTSFDPLITFPLAEYVPMPEEIEIPAEIKPRLAAKIRPESWGYALMGKGHVVPVGSDALALLEACDGNTSFSDLALQFGDEGLDLLGELWRYDMLVSASATQER